jgi:hypothetical protein
MERQHEVAVEESYSFLRTAADVKRLAASGALVPVSENADLALSGVSFPFARPEVRSFAEHFAARYREATGERLVVTSLTRPEALQPRNAHALSVHPTGMAVDLRVPAGSSQRAWFEGALADMQRQGLIDVTRERTPPHYHIAVFAERWTPFAARQDSIAAAGRARAIRPPATPVTSASKAPPPPEGSLPGFLLTMAALTGLAVPSLRVVQRPNSRT